MSHARTVSMLAMLAIGAPVAARASTSATTSRAWGTIVWDDPTGSCSDDGLTASLVEANIDATKSRDPIFVRAEVSKGRVGRLRATLFLRRGGSWTSRDVDVGTCDELVRAVSVVVALSYEMGLGEDASSAPAVPVAPAAAPEAVAEPALPGSPDDEGGAERARATAAPRAAGRTAFTVWLAPALDVGTLPAAAPGGRLRIGLERDGWSVAIAGLVLPAVSGSVSARGEGASVGAASVGARGCLRFPLGPARTWEVGPCAGASYGRYWASGFGMVDARSTAADYASVEGAIDVSVELTRALRLRGSAEGVLHATRPTFFVGGAGDVHQPSVLALRLAVGPEITF